MLNHNKPFTDVVPLATSAPCMHGLEKSMPVLEALNAFISVIQPAPLPGMCMLQRVKGGECCWERCPEKLKVMSSAFNAHQALTTSKITKVWERKGLST
eukprot:1160202-Pelagomonas_calceolata.AAC.1